MCEKDYNLLRLFDLEAAKRGEAVTCNTIGTVLHYVAGPDVDRTVCVKCEGGQFCLYKPEKLRMAPLAWVEGRPVYKGDVLYHSREGKFVVTGLFSSEFTNLGPSFSWGGEDSGLLASACTWTPPKVKREGWVNVYSGDPVNKIAAGVSHAHTTRDEADRHACATRIACVRIEWEE